MSAFKCVAFAAVVVQVVVCVVNATVFRGSESKGPNWAEQRSGS